MTIRTTLAAMALALLPGLAAAQGCSYDKETSASACGEGQTYDAVTKSCVTAASS